MPSLVRAVRAVPMANPNIRILDLDGEESRHAIFISQSRRDPAALNMAYAMVLA